MVKRVRSPEQIIKRNLQNKDWRNRNKEKLKVYDSSRYNYSLETHYLKTYNLSLEELERLSLRQDNKCAGCGISSQDATRQKLYVDHCHLTGNVRGLLCHHCNTALGLVKDNLETLKNLISYLEITSNDDLINKEKKQNS